MYVLCLLGCLQHDDFLLSQYIVKNTVLINYTKMKSSLHYPVITFGWFCIVYNRINSLVHFLLIPKSLQIHMNSLLSMNPAALW